MTQQKTCPRFVAKEWDASGAFHFYGSHKPRSYIIEVFTAEAIRGELLQQALDKAARLFPEKQADGHE